MSLRKQGRHLQIGLTTSAEKGEIPVPIDRIVTMELQLIAIARDAGVALSRDAADGRSRARISPKAMVTGTCDLAGINQGFQGDEHVPERRRHGHQQVQLTRGSHVIERRASAALLFFFRATKWLSS